jgi:hypothetical protein
MREIPGGTMPLTFHNDRLLDAAPTWNGSGCIIIVDETTGDNDVSGDREVSHRLQSAVLARAGTLGFRIYIVAYGGAGATGTYQGNLGAELGRYIPANTPVFYKDFLETDGFTNENLGAVIGTAGHAHAIIMGQSRNACCAATARGAVAAGLSVHTAPSLTRGGGMVATSDFENFGGIVWPNGTHIYASV